MLLRTITLSISPGLRSSLIASLQRSWNSRSVSQTFMLSVRFPSSSMSDPSKCGIHGALMADKCATPRPVAHNGPIQIRPEVLATHEPAGDAFDLQAPFGRRLCGATNPLVYSASGNAYSLCKVRLAVGQEVGFQVHGRLNLAGLIHSTPAGLNCASVSGAILK